MILQMDGESMITVIAIAAATALGVTAWSVNDAKARAMISCDQLKVAAMAANKPDVKCAVNEVK